MSAMKLTIYRNGLKKFSLVVGLTCEVGVEVLGFTVDQVSVIIYLLDRCGTK